MTLNVGCGRTPGVYLNSHTLCSLIPILKCNKALFVFRFSKGYDHKSTSKDEHHYEISCPTPKGALLQHPAVTISKHHVEEEIEAHGSKE